MGNCKARSATSYRRALISGAPDRILAAASVGLRSPAIGFARSCRHEPIAEQQLRVDDSVPRIHRRDGVPASRRTESHIVDKIAGGNCAEIRGFRSPKETTGPKTSPRAHSSKAHSDSSKKSPALFKAPDKLGGGDTTGSGGSR